MTDSTEKMAKQLAKDEMIVLELISHLPTKNIKLTPIEPHKYILEFSPENPNIAARFKFNKDRTRLSVSLTGIPLDTTLKFAEDAQIRKAIELAVNQRKNALTRTDRLVDTHNDIALCNLNDSLNKYFKQKKCSDIRKMIFPNTKKAQIEYRKNISFKSLKQMDIKEITLRGRHFTCDYENGIWVED